MERSIRELENELEKSEADYGILQDDYKQLLIDIAGKDSVILELKKDCAYYRNDWKDRVSQPHRAISRLTRWQLSFEQPESLDLDHEAQTDIAWAADEIIFCRSLLSEWLSIFKITQDPEKYPANHVANKTKKLIE